MKDYIKPEVEYIDFIAEKITGQITGSADGENSDPFA